MSLYSFQAEVWKNNLETLLGRSGFAPQIVTRIYADNVKNSGDVVVFNEDRIENIDGCFILNQLIMDHKKYFAFRVDDIHRAQNNLDITLGYLERAKVAIDLSRDTIVHSKYFDVPSCNIYGEYCNPILLTENNIDSFFDNFIDMIWKGNQWRKDRFIPYVVIPPSIEELIIKSPSLKTLLKGAIRNSSIGAYETEKGNHAEILVMSNMFDVDGRWNILGGWNDAIVYDEHVTDIEALRLPDSSDAAIRGLIVFGAKTVKPKNLYLMICQGGKYGR